MHTSNKLLCRTAIFLSLGFLTACAAPISGQISGSPFDPHKILVASLMGNESDRGTSSFEATLSQGLQDCGIEHKSIYQEQNASQTLSLSDNGALFEQTLRHEMEVYKPDALLEVTLVSTSGHPQSILARGIVSGHYAIHLTALPSKTLIWQGNASDGDVLGIDTRAALAKNIVERLKKDGAIQCPSTTTH
jgi:hypothetical protein